MAYITSTDISRAIGANTLIALCDDDNDGTADSAVVTAIIERADAEADSWIAPSYDVSFPISSPPQLLKNLSLEYAIIFAFERNPDYLRAFEQPVSLEKRKARADAMGLRLQQATQRMATYATDPENVGGIIYDPSPRATIVDRDGNDQGTGF